jgi:pentatricopeptide repeat protein
MEEVKKKNQNISLIIFTCYMKTCFTTLHIDEALATYNLINQYNLKPDSITYSTLIRGLISNKRKEGMVEVIRDSLKRNIPLSHICYIEVIKFLNSFGESNKEEVNELIEELGTYGIALDTISMEITQNIKNQIINNNNETSNFINNNISNNKVNYLFNGYKLRGQFKKNEKKQKKFFKNYNNFNNFNNLNNNYNNKYNNFNNKNIQLDEMSKLSITLKENNSDFLIRNTDTSTNPNSGSSYKKLTPTNKSLSFIPSNYYNNERVEKNNNSWKRSNNIGRTDKFSYNYNTYNNIIERNISLILPVVSSEIDKDSKNLINFS